jgi:small-conductance mechanosensitive channel
MDINAWVDWNEFGPYLRTTMRIVLICGLALVLHVVSHRLIKGLRVFIQRATRSEESKRLETLGRVFRYAASVVILVVAAMLILAELGIAIAPILGAAGVVGVAVGFGAQSLIKDYFNGFFLLLENQIQQGDVCEVGGKAGFVEEVTLRYVRLRDYSGSVHFVPNGLISTVTNMSRDFAFALMDIGVAYRENVDEVLPVMRTVAAELRAAPVFAEKIIEDIDIAGVETWADSAVIIRCRFKVRPLEQWNVRREYLRRLKSAFDAHGIEIPYPHLTVYAGEAKDGGTAPFRFLAAQSPEAAERA